MTRREIRQKKLPKHRAFLSKIQQLKNEGFATTDTIFQADAKLRKRNNIPPRANITSLRCALHKKSEKIRHEQIHGQLTLWHYEEAT